MAADLQEQAVQVERKAAKITAAALKGLIEQILANRGKITHGEQSLKKLNLQAKKLESIELTGEDAPHTYTATKVVLDIEGEPFTATGREEIDLGFKQIDDQVKKAVKAQEEKEDAPDTPENAVLPPMSEGNTFTASEVKAEPKKTKPQPSYTEDTLLKAMETAGKSIVDEELKDAMKDSGLGTPATRAGILSLIHI